MNPAAIIAIVGLVLDVLKQLEASGVLQQHSQHTPALKQARAAIAAFHAEATTKPDKKGAEHV